ncbi:tail fiber assembly protein [Enterobacter bugandensis]|uniref:tail fiber assembly protein n=1 Tax=Enterobacter bugandensis TaxID=881260 RepID=UPI0013D40047|nr:tail fiber assembly protein [Enterobacter bugandensis]
MNAMPLVTLSNLTLYVPEQRGLAPDDALFLKSDEGADWYQAQIHFSEHTRKIGYDKDGLILIQHKNIWALWPVDMSVSEVLESDLPEKFPAPGEFVQGWMFKDGSIVPIPVNYADIAAKEKSRLLQEVSIIINPLQDAVELGIATESESARLQEWKRYRVLLNRVDPNEPDWPLKPTQ